MMHNKPFKVQLLFLLLLVVVGTGCGYKFTGGGTLPAGTGVICISLFDNRSTEVMLENTIVNDLIYEFTRNGQQTDTDKESADSIMTGEILSVTSDTVTHTTSLTSKETRVTLVLSAQLKNQQGNVLWETRRISDSEVYTLDTDGNAVNDSAARKEALKEISERIATKIYAAMTEDF